ADYLAGFTAWTPGSSGIAITRVNWNGNDFTLGAPSVTSVNEVHSAAKGVRMALGNYAPDARRVTFLLDSPLELEAKLEVFDAQGRRTVSLLDGKLARGRTAIVWELSNRDGGRVASGVYFARLSFAGGNRSVRIPVAW